MFLEEPGNGEVFLPINSSQTLTCSVTEDYIISSWQFQPQPGSTFSLNNDAELGLVQNNFQIDLTVLSRMLSKVTLNVTEELNETQLTCLAVSSNGLNSERREALFIVYGKY